MRTALAAAFALVCAAVVGTATAADRAAGARTVKLHRGDAVAVSGTSLHCSVSTQAPITLACGKGTARGPSVGTYGFALADAVAIVLRVGPAGRSGVLLRRRQPALAGPGTRAEPASARGSTVGDGTVLVVAGTHVVCVVSAQSTGNALSCGLSLAGSGTFGAGTFFAILTDSEVLLGRKLATGAERVLHRDQP